MKRLSILCAALAAAGSALALELNVEPGTLSSLIPELNPSATSLYLIGSIDARDMAAFNLIPDNFKTLGLKDVRIVEYRGEIPSFPGQSVFYADCIPDQLLFDSHFQNITLPRNAVLGTGICANSAQLNSITVSEGTTVIPAYAFYGCPNLTAIQIPASVSSLGKSAFAACPALGSIDLSATSVSEIPDRCMAGDSSLTSLSLPAGITAIGSEILTGTGVTYISLKNLQTAAPFALAGMPALTEAYINPSCDFEPGLLMGNHALLSVNGTPADIPELFVADSPQVDTASVLEGATSIGRYAFSRGAFQTLVLPVDLQYIDRSAFAYAGNLRYIYAKDLQSNIPEVHQQAFDGITPENIILYVAQDCTEQWKAHPVWSRFQIIPDGSVVNSLSSVEGDIRFSLAGNKLSVSAPEAIKDIHVWLTDGSLIFSATPDTEKFETMLNLPESQKLVIVKASTSEASRSATLLAR